MLYEDYSSNARSDTLDKYSRFFGKTEFSNWCNEPTLKYTEGFRDLVYQVNPHYISCVYKKMFDACATNQLRIVDDDGVIDDEKDRSMTNSSAVGLANSSTENLTPRSLQTETVDRSNSCIYSQPNLTGSQNGVKNIAGKCKDLCGWFICGKPHSITKTVYQSTTVPETKDTCRRPLYTKVLSPRTFQDNIRYARQSPIRKRHALRYGSANISEVSHKPPLRDASENESTGRQCSSSSSCISAINSPIKVGKCFKHFKRCVSYIDQYREEYTYRKLYENIEKQGIALPEQRDCSCGKQFCTGCPVQPAASSSQRWYPHQSQPTEKSQSVPPGLHAPKWPQALKTRSQNSVPKPARVPVHVLIPQLEGVQRKDRTPWSKELKQKMGFFATSLTINNYNPTRPPSPCQQHRCSSTPMASVITSKSGGSMKGHRQCSSTPTRQDRHLNQNIKSAL